VIAKTPTNPYTEIIGIGKSRSNKKPTTTKGTRNMAKRSKVREQRETELYNSFREGITYALDKVIAKELGTKWTVTLHMARMEELLRVVDEHTYGSVRKMRMVQERRHTEVVRAYETHLTENAGA